MDNPDTEHKHFLDLLKGLAGQIITVVNPESYEAAPIGYQIKAGFYKAKVTHVGADYFTVVSEFQHAGKGAKKEPVKQFIPMSRVKRISVMKTDRLIHL